ncbi:putative bifunctional diguanylate cyclase/phosphodiesterase [Alterisphingorhabdus coralli]|uniref:EAL domain-containing protein n=1 Tax=Alterisphingorhabdus coralli TaxID=3071408 RepID=A0AA97F6L9_9SPHN|nr:EAL domain-containing protein [Parasphingorhabdus sp. SCSIO 66989]WOE74227.1 EAL domain-containing protein [Parasphingorhabdus sp. SCSIO 66989]
MTETLLTPEDGKPLPLLGILGLSKPEGFDWDKIRAIQFERFSHIGFMRVIANVLGIILVAQIHYLAVPMALLASWVVGSLLAIIGNALVTRARQRKGGRNNFEISSGAAKGIAAGGVISGLSWSVPILLFSQYGTVDQHSATWTIIAALMVGSSMILSTMPLGAVLFAMIVGVASTFSFILTNQFVMASAAICLMFILIAACLETARDYLSYRLSVHGLNEKSEVVSLLLREFEESGADWLWQIDPSRRVSHVSPRFAYALGRTVDEVEGHSLLELIAGTSWETGKFHSSLHDLAEKLKRRESFSNLMVRVHIGEKIRWWELSASPKLDDNGVFLGFRGVGSDVTEQRESAEKIAHMARYDTLTGLPNRLHITEATDKAMRDSEKWRQRSAFLMIDLDRFKTVNDTLGHLVGDRLLAQVSQRLNALMTKNEMCGRLGGDEFAVLIKEVPDTSYIQNLSQKIIEALSGPYEVDQHTVFVGASIGSAIAPRDGRTVEMLVRNADLALYRSKDEGGNKHHGYEPKLHMHAEERRIMEIALRKALANDEFTLNFQPIVRAEREEICGFEVLLRWHNPELGHVSPAKFIPLAEDARLIVPIGRWVLENACKEAMNWPVDTKLSVNVSAGQLSDPNFMTILIEALSSSGLPPQRLDIEVTESIFLHEGTMAIDVLDKILSLGVGLSLDDFGTGYSSLGYLRKTRFTNIKIDRSFVQGAARDVPESLAIVRAVVALADSLGMSTTAEGVEDEAEARRLTDLGCKKIQGYYYGRPMPADEASQLFTLQQRKSA